MSVVIKEVNNRRDLKRFVYFPFRLYKNSKYWVPPMIKGEMGTLSPKKNPAFEHCETRFLLAIKNGKIAGRIVGIINHRYIEHWGKKDARFSWFDTIDDKEVTRLLFDDIEEWAKSKGMERVVGPMGFTTFERQGILVKGFEEMPTHAGVHNYPYYAEHLESMGYGKEIEYVEYELVVPKAIPEKIIKISTLVTERYGLRLLKASSAKEMLPYADPVFRVINAAYKPLYGFTALTEKQINYFVKKFFHFITPDFTSAVLDENGRVLGFQISMPSLSRAMKQANGRLFPFGWYYLTRAMKKPERIDTLLTGVIPEYQNKGVNAVFMLQLTESAINNGIKYAESNSELEENFKVQNTWRYFESRQHRRSRLYARSLS
jgi:GNAT superfamily N-acetyltransferase